MKDIWRQGINIYINIIFIIVFVVGGGAAAVAVVVRESDSEQEQNTCCPNALRWTVTQDQFHLYEFSYNPGTKNFCLSQQHHM